MVDKLSIEECESEDFEQKSLFTGKDKEWLGLIKTILLRPGDLRIDVYAPLDETEEE